VPGPCRVLYLVPSIGGGGVGRVVIEHLRRLPRDRIAPEVAVFDPQGALRGEVPADVPFHHIRARGRVRFFSHRHGLRELLDSRPFDVVTSHLAHPNVVNLLESFRRPNPRVARVTTIHADRRGAGRLDRHARLLLFFQRLFSREASRIVFLCRETADAVARMYGARPEQVAVIPNGVDPEQLSALAQREPPPEWPGPGLRMIAAGRLVSQKGFDILLPAFADARRRGLLASLVVLGEGPERPALERLRDDLGLGAVVTFPGNASNPYPAMRHADLFLLPSRLEGFPLVLLEALALGRPIVAAACPAGPAELLGEGAGVLVPPRDPLALATAILALAADPARRADLSRRAAERAEAYRWAPIIERTAAMLLEAAGRG